MKYLRRIFETNIENKSEYYTTSDAEEFNNGESVDIPSGYINMIEKKTRLKTSSSSEYGWYYICTDPKTSIFVWFYMTREEYFMVELRADTENFKQSWFKCDQVEGLIKLLNNYNTSQK
jgi:hypothetical protein